MDALRVHGAAEVRALLVRLVDSRAPLHLNAPGGAVYTTTLQRLDVRRGVAAFAADAASPALRRVLAAREITAVGYLDQVKLQFELHGVMLIEGHCASVLSASLPRELFRFQRRAHLRVRPSPGSEPSVALRHPAQPALALALGVLDVSLGGIALLVPEEVPPLAPGLRIDGAAVALDADTHFVAGLLTHYVSAIEPEARTLRLGCEWFGLTDEARRTLAGFIDRMKP
jgi:c-di-GMP-binding flagellar brake protein YcgR